jgi:pimeloyl-ACP methyl ester carboxylesterase
MTHLSTRLTRFVATLCFVIIGFAANAQTHTAKSVSLPNTNGYWEYLPQGYNPASSETYPVIIFIHGVGELGNGSPASLQSLLGYGLPMYINWGQFPSSVTVNGQTHKFIVISPQWIGWPGPDNINSLIDYVSANYRINPNRIYVTGLSMGGGTTWDFAGSYPNRPAAIVPICGASWPDRNRARSIASGNIPIWAFHNSGDPTVPVGYTHDYVSIINEAPSPNPQALKTIFNSGSHDAWSTAYNPNYRENGLNVYEWMLQYAKGTPPPNGNVPPTANAGADQNIVFPVTSLQLNGSGNDPDGSIASYKWTKVSGPDQFTINNNTISNPVISNMAAGEYTFRLLVSDNRGGQASDDVKIKVTAAIPGRVEAESFNTAQGVNVEGTADAGGGSNVGYIDNGDWMDYEVQVNAAGTYNMSVRIATLATNASFQVRNSAGLVLATFDVPFTGGWQAFNTISKTITLPAGRQVLRLVSTKADGWNFNWMDFAAGATAPVNQVPTVNAGTDQTITLPANSVQLGATANDADGNITSYSWTKVSGPAEGNFSNPNSSNPTFSGLAQGTYILKVTATDNSGATASDEMAVVVNAAPVTPPAVGSGVRIQAENWTAMKGVGTEGTSDAGGGLSVGWIDNTDWMDYAINLSQGGTYTVGFRVATPATSGQLKLLNAAGTTLATVNVPNTGWWQNWQTVTATVTLPAGQQTLRVLSSSADAWNFNWFELTAGGSGSAPANQLPTVNAGNDQTITLPTSSVQLSATATDADGTIASYTWTKVSGPAEGNFSSTTVANPTFNGLAQGTYTLKVTATDNSGATASDEVVVTVNASAAAGSTAPALRIQAENWTGMKGVGTEGTSDDGGGLSVGWIDNTDWMDYSVNITQAGTYTVGFRVASPATSGQLKLLNAAGTTLATVNVPNTGWWQNWQTATATVTLPAGQQTLRVLSSSADAWNFNWFEIGSGSSAAPANQLPTVNAGTDQTITLPTSSVQLGATATDADGTIASYSWTKVSGPAGNFSSTTVANPTFSGLVQGTYTLKVTATDNSGATASDEIVITVNAAPIVSNSPAIRVEAEKWTAMSGVGTEGTSDVGGGLSVGWIDNNDWMDYSVNMPTAGTYVVSFRVASPATSGQLQLRNAAGTVLATVAVPNTGWWQNWQSVSATVTLPAGQQTLRVVSTSADAWNFNYFELAGSGAVATRSLGEAEVEGTTVSAETLEVFPNPVSDRFVLKVASPLTGTMKVQVVDMAGTVQKQFTLQKTAAGATQNYLSAQGLAKGEYILQVQIGEWNETIKLVKL